MDPFLFLIFISRLLVIYFNIELRFWKKNTSESNLIFWKNMSDFLIFILIIYLFHPFSKNPVNISREQKLYLFTFALLAVINDNFIKTVHDYLNNK